MTDSQVGAPTRIVGFVPAGQPQPQPRTGRSAVGSSRAAESPLSRMLREDSSTPPTLRGVMSRADSEMSEDGNESSGSGGSSRLSYDEAFAERPADSQPQFQHGASLPVSIPGSEYRRCERGPAARSFAARSVETERHGLLGRRGSVR